MSKPLKKKKGLYQRPLSVYEKLMIKSANKTTIYFSGKPKTVYQIYLKSDGWKRKRNGAMARAKGICQRCKVSKATQVHHKHYKNIFHEKTKDLVALCGICHAIIHNKISIN